MEKTLISHNKHWKTPYKGFYNRTLLKKLISRLSTKHIQVLQGIRRSGKSTLFKLLINHLLDSVDGREILYVNLDAPFFISYSKSPEKLHEIAEIAEKMTGKKVKYLFLDEIQAMQGWEKYIKEVYDNADFKKIFITGSNSSLLNGEYASLLSGRYLSDKVYPLSFSEILTLNAISSYLDLLDQHPKVMSIIDNMLKYGSFAEVLECNQEHKRDLLTSYYDTVLLKDCIGNNQIRDTKSFKELSYYLISNATSLYSYNSLAKAIGTHGMSIKEHLQILQNAYLLDELKHFSYSLKAQQNKKKKPYFIDNGFLSLSFKFSSGSGVLLENLVLSELIKTNKEVYYYNDGFECDFIVKNPDHSLEAIQVCHELHDQNRKREIGGLLKMAKKLDVNSRIIITYAQEEKIGRDGIEVIPFWKYFGGMLS